MVRYDSPSFGGVYGSFSHAFEQTAGADDTVTSLLLGYKDGGLNVALGFQDEKTKQEYTQLAASYDFGTFALSGGYSTRKADAAANGKDTEYNLGVEVPFGAVKVSAGYASSETKISGAKASEPTKYQIAVRSTGELSNVLVLDTNGQPETSAIAQRIVKVLADDIK